MSTFEESQNAESRESLLDRLVDGEMSEADRRTLLLQLEHEPDGWRRCALAFLESQSWKQELGLVAEPHPAAQSAAVVVPASPAERTVSLSRRWRQHLATALTMGACFLIALALGLMLRGWSGGGVHAPGSSDVKEATLTIPLKQPQEALPPAPAAQAADNWEVVALSTDAPNGQSETVRVPAVERKTLDQNMLQQYPGAMPPEVAQAFEQSGHHVVQQREIVPVQMNDGRRLMVPVDHVEIHYVGRGSL